MTNFLKINQLKKISNVLRNIKIPHKRVYERLKKLFWYFDNYPEFINYDYEEELKTIEVAEKHVEDEKDEVAEELNNVIASLRETIKIIDDIQED